MTAIVAAVLGISLYSGLGSSLAAIQQKFAALDAAGVRLNSLDKLILSLVL